MRGKYSGIGGVLNHPLDSLHEVNIFAMLMNVKTLIVSKIVDPIGQQRAGILIQEIQHCSVPYFCEGDVAGKRAFGQMHAAALLCFSQVALALCELKHPDTVGA